MMKIRGLKAALNSTGQYPYKPPESIVDHIVIGAGVIGLAIGRYLALKYPEKSTYVVERNERAGEETSSRNSEVIHAGLYYPPNSHKSALCIRGRELLYEYCRAKAIPHRKCGKLVVAVDSPAKKKGNLKTNSQAEYLEKLYENARALSIPIHILTGSSARQLEPDLSKDVTAALYSPETGILDSHAFMDCLLGDIRSSGSHSAAPGNADVVFGTRVVRVDPYVPEGGGGFTDASENDNDNDNALRLELGKESGWVVQMATSSTEAAQKPYAVLAKTLINASGLSANLALNSLISGVGGGRVAMYFARGRYAAYAGPGAGGEGGVLIYPCPGGVADAEEEEEEGEGGKMKHAFQSLGTHLTRDIAGRVKFGPDIEWIGPPSLQNLNNASSDAEEKEEEEEEEEYTTSAAHIDFWKAHLAPGAGADDAREREWIAQMCASVRRYLPGVQEGGFRADYVGVRPKLAGPGPGPFPFSGGGFQDFVFRVDYPDDFASRLLSAKNDSEARKRNPMMTLLGFESPGLTASLAVAEKVGEMLREHEMSMDERIN